MASKKPETKEGEDVNAKKKVVQKEAFRSFNNGPPPRSPVGERENRSFDNGPQATFP